MNKAEANMFDLHCHLAFCISDGPESIDDARVILEQAAAEGVTYITAVAHYGKYFDHICGVINELRPDAERLGVTLHPSMEYDYVHLDEVSPDELVFVGPKSRYILLDFHRDRIPYSAPMRLFELSEKDIGIIIVHPEKLFKAEMLPLLQQFSEGGMALQLNALSFLPDSPPRVRKMADMLLRKGLAHLVASDAHRKDGVRRYAMREARKIVEQTYGGKVAELLFEINPARILDNLPPLEMPTFPDWLEKLRIRWLGRWFSVLWKTAAAAELRPTP